MKPGKWALALTIWLASAIGSLADDEGNRIWILGLTNGSVVSGVVEFPVRFAITNKDRIAGMNVYGANRPILGMASMSVADYRGWLSRYGTNGPVFADTNNDDRICHWNTHIEVNGNYAVQAELDFISHPPVVSQPVSVTVSNLFSFPNGISELFDSHMWIYFQTIPGATVQIDIYGQDTRYVGSFLPTSDTNGFISFLWDLTDGNGYRYEDSNFGGVFTLKKTPAVSHQVSRPNLRITTMPPYMRLQKFDKRASLRPTGNGGYQVDCQWYSRPK